MEKLSSKTKELQNLALQKSGLSVETSRKSFQFILIEKDAIKKLKFILEPYDFPILVTDTHLYLKYNEKINELVDRKQIDWIKVLDKNDFLCKKELKNDIVVGFGGGKSLDLSKLISKKFNIDWISVPTAASHDGIASDLASVQHNGYSYSEKCKPPLGIVADLSILESAPPMLKLGGFGDVLSKISSLAEWLLAHENSNELFDWNIYNSIKSAINYLLKDISLEALIQAEIICGKAMTNFGSSRPCSGTEHAISHSMDRFLNSLHGLQVVFATLICNYYLEEIGYSIYNNDQLHKFMTVNNIPRKLDDFNISVNQYLNIISHAIKLMEKRKRYSVFKHLKLNDQSMLATIKKVYY